MTASIVGVGIYVPDDAADVLPTDTDNELVEELEDDDRVTGETSSERPEDHSTLKYPVLGLDTTVGDLVNSNASY